MSRHKAEARRRRRKLEKRRQTKKEKKDVQGVERDVDVDGAVDLLMRREAAREQLDEVESEPLSRTNAKGRQTSGEKVQADSNWHRIREQLSSDGKKIPSRKKRKVAGAVNMAERGSALSPSAGDAEPTKVIAMDCEMVGVGPEGKENALARVSIVNADGQILLDTYVTAKEKVTDYRTEYSGIRPENLIPANSMQFAEVQERVHKLLLGSTLVGHSVHHDLAVLMLSHPKKDVRDIAKYKPLCQPIQTGKAIPSLRRMAAEILGREIQQKEHDSVEDARATLDLYKRVARKWEREAMF